MSIKYKKISPCIWNDAKVNKLSALGKLAFIYMLTHPQQTSVGAIRTTIKGLSFEVKDLPLEAFAEVFAEGLAEGSAEAPLITFPNFLKYNQPESPNVANSWGKSFLDLPECTLKDKLYDTVLQVLADKGEQFMKGFAKGLGKDFRYSVPLSEAVAEAEQPSLPRIEVIFSLIREGKPWTCPACSCVIPTTDIFCPNCGVTLEEIENHHWGK